MALGYYTIISFLGYNGMSSDQPEESDTISLTRLRASPSLPPPHRAAPLTNVCLYRALVRQSFRLQFAKAHNPAAIDRRKMIYSRVSYVYTLYSVLVTIASHWAVGQGL